MKFLFIEQTKGGGAHGTIYTGTPKRLAYGAWLDAGSACGEKPPLQACFGKLREGQSQRHQPATHPDFPRLMADLEIYVNGIAGKQVQSANAIVDAVSATIMKQHNPGLTAPQLRQLNRRPY